MIFEDNGRVGVLNIIVYRKVASGKLSVSLSTRKELTAAGSSAFYTTGTMTVSDWYATILTDRNR